ncbi:ATPase [Chachezhania antarctica]|uniref:ATPase n=1 Tax=Chachezhania antarctica TaxID=2340860 RepID=UPI000EB15B91|nr:ATPase [Chachezhania antarctica]
MIYETGDEWRAAPQKRVLVFGMSGLGKTFLSQILRESGDWFHYSIDYRIGTRYMGEYITDDARAYMMQVPFLRNLLMTDSISVIPNLSFSNLNAVTAYLGKPGDPDRGGLPLENFQERQDQFRIAEVRALLDTEYFISRSERLYGYPHFICDTGGSICEWVDPFDPADEVMAALSACTLMIWLKGDDAHTEALVRRFDRAPKPMSYQPEFLARTWESYLDETGAAPDQVDPDGFIRYAYARALAHRQPRYEAMAKWGVTVPAAQMEQISDPEGFVDIIAKAIDARNTGDGA